MSAEVTLKLAFYGDDFTGSTDALEALARCGLRTALFLSPPDGKALARVGPLDAFGVAGDSRTMTPQQMDTALPAVFDALARSGAPIVHYKVCSTFDSAPGIGSIGHAMEIARSHFHQSWIPVVGGTPALRRFCAFGHLFARSGTDGQVYRIDRHPIMRAHPVTPMDESDLMLHLGRQAPLALANMPFTALDSGAEAAEQHLAQLVHGGAEAVVLDSLSEPHLTEVGRLLWRNAHAGQPIFVVGPSGVEYALTQWWRRSGQIPAAPHAWQPFKAAQRVLSVSASASALSARQIDAAVAAGYAPLEVDAAALVSQAAHGPRGAAHAALMQQAVTLLASGRSVILHTARGPNDPRIEAAAQVLCDHDGMEAHAARREAGRRIGQQLGAITRAVLQTGAAERLLVSGGDSASRIVQALAPDALLMSAPLAPGAPMCRAIAREPWLDGLELALKGGQMGDERFFETAKNGLD